MYFEEYDKCIVGSAMQNIVYNLLYVINRVQNNA